MIGINVIFHVASALIAIALIYWLMRLRGQRNTLRTLLRPEQGRHIEVVEPRDFLEKLCVASGISFEGDEQKGGPAKIHWQPWRQLFSGASVEAIHWQYESGKGKATILLKEEWADPNRQSVQAHLSKALGPETTVAVKKDSGSSGND